MSNPELEVDAFTELPRLNADFFEQNGSLGGASKLGILPHDPPPVVQVP